MLIGICEHRDEILKIYGFRIKNGNDNSSEFLLPRLSAHSVRLGFFSLIFHSPMFILQWVKDYRGFLFIPDPVLGQFRSSRGGLAQILNG